MCDENKKQKKYKATKQKNLILKQNAVIVEKKNHSCLNNCLNNKKEKIEKEKIEKKQCEKSIKRTFVD